VSLPQIIICPCHPYFVLLAISLQAKKKQKKTNIQKVPMPGVEPVTS
jgi:hypothetical protein